MKIGKLELGKNRNAVQMSKRIVLTLDEEEYKLFKKPKNLGEKDSVRSKNIIMNWLMEREQCLKK